MATGLALVASVLCPAAAMRASPLIASALWLAGSSALLATALYFLEAPYVAVIELRGQAFRIPAGCGVSIWHRNYRQQHAVGLAHC